MTDLTQPLDTEQMRANIIGQLDTFDKETHTLREKRNAINARLKVIDTERKRFDRMLRAIEGRKRGQPQ